jgi:protoporphyrinogen IX oxidase
MDYLWLKALHVAAVLVWIGGLFAAAFIVATASKESPGEPGREPGRMALIEAIRRWDRRVTSPALLVVWGAGLALAMQGAWFPAPWLIVKLGIVILLSALHGILSGTLRRRGHSDASSPPSWLQYAPLVIIGGVTAIVVLVVIKPI